MKIYIKNIIRENDVLNKILTSQFNTSYNKTEISRIYSKSGIYVFNHDEKSSIYKLTITDKPIIEKIKDNIQFIIDESEMKLLLKSHQIPYHHFAENCIFHIFKINDALDIYLIIEEQVSKCDKTIDLNTSAHSNSSKYSDIYFYLKNNTDHTNNMDNILSNIVTFLSSFNFC
jgi:hypothetical protein